MSDFDIYAVIDGDAGLTLDEAHGYLITAAGPGARIWRRITETSPFIDDEEEISRTLAPGSVLLSTLILAASDSQLTTRITAFIAAVEQSAYNLSVVVNGVVRNKWACRCADSAPGGDSGSLDARRLANHQQMWTATIPRSPIPVVGPS